MGGFLFGRCFFLGVFFFGRCFVCCCFSSYSFFRWFPGCGFFCHFFLSCGLFFCSFFGGGFFFHNLFSWSLGTFLLHLFLLRCLHFGFDKFEETQLGRIALAMSGADDAGVAAFAFAVLGRNFVEQNADSLDVVQFRYCSTPVVQGAGFAQGNHAFGQAASFLCLGDAGFDAAFENQAADLITQHGTPMVWTASDLECMLAMSHD